MIEKQTKLDRMEILSNGVIQIRLAKQIVEDGVVISQSWHRTVIPPVTNPSDQMAAVNTHLIQMGFPALTELTELESIAGIIQTEDRKQAWIDKQEELPDLPNQARTVK